jgi:hypothetical protein
VDAATGYSTFWADFLDDFLYFLTIGVSDKLPAVAGVFSALFLSLLSLLLS